MADFLLISKLSSALPDRNKELVVPPLHNASIERKLSFGGLRIIPNQLLSEAGQVSSRSVDTIPLRDFHKVSG